MSDTIIIVVTGVFLCLLAIPLAMCLKILRDLRNDRRRYWP